mmetsp:Transcript_96519/g.268252  ORF Transcript_96519/g.268252 Transcript_96519/m.268252 type:complete len:84 (+) Transcript_96519:1389-1640(+)
MSSRLAARLATCSASRLASAASLILRTRACSIHDGTGKDAKCAVLGDEKGRVLPNDIARTPNNPLDAGSVRAFTHARAALVVA